MKLSQLLRGGSRRSAASNTRFLQRNAVRARTINRVERASPAMRRTNCRTEQNRALARPIEPLARKSRREFARPAANSRRECSCARARLVHPAWQQEEQRPRRVHLTPGRVQRRASISDKHTESGKRPRGSLPIDDADER